MKKSLIYIAILFQSVCLSAQAEIFHFNNPLIAKAAVLNPAFLPRYGLHVGFHSQTYFSPGQIQINDVFSTKYDAFETVRRILADSTKDFKNIQLDQEIGLLEIGIRSRRSYLHMSSKITLSADLNLDKDILGLAFFGNGDTQYYKKTANINFSGTDIRLMSKHRTSYGRQFGSKLYIGASAAIIHGLGRLNIERANFDITTDTSLESIYQVQVKGNIDASSTGFRGSIFKLWDPVTYVTALPFVNYGFAFGGGIIYRPYDFLRISVSTDNHGFTEWNNFYSVHQLKVNINNFQGLDSLTPLAQGGRRPLRGELNDTLNSWYSLYENDTYDKDYQTLRPNYIIGFEYLGIPKHRMAFIYGNGLGVRSNVNLISFSEYFDINQYLQVYGSYSRYFSPNKENILNLGFSVQGVGLQLFGQLNNVIGILQPALTHHYYSAQLGVGFNFVKNLDKDRDDIPDHRDNCPDIYGVPRYRGCPEHTFKPPHIIDDKRKRLKKIKRIEEIYPKDRK